MKHIRNNIGGIVYFLVWGAFVLSFWLGVFSYGNEMLFSILSLYVVLPIGALIVSAYYGTQPGPAKWCFVILAAALPVLCQSLTFDLANTLAFGRMNGPKLEFAVLTLVPALLGVGIGSIFKRKKKQRYIIESEVIGRGKGGDL